jgi:hypothetical protein
MVDAPGYGKMKVLSLFVRVWTADASNISLLGGLALLTARAEKDDGKPRDGDRATNQDAPRGAVEFFVIHETISYQNTDLTIEEGGCQPPLEPHSTGINVPKSSTTAWTFRHSG